MEINAWGEENEKALLQHYYVIRHNTAKSASSNCRKKKKEEKKKELKWHDRGEKSSFPFRRKCHSEKYKNQKQMKR